MNEQDNELSKELNKKGKEILDELVKTHEKINTVINEQVSPESAFHQTVLNIKKTFFEGIAPNTTNKSVKFYTLGSDKVETILKNTKENKLGIYIFMLKLGDSEENIEDFKNDWREFKNGDLKLSIPALNEKAEPYSKKVKGRKEYMYALYIGKSETLSERLKQHIQKGSDSTYCLRLEQFNKYIQKKKRRYKIEVCYLYSNDDNISHILYPLERLLRSNFIPLLGSAR